MSPEAQTSARARLRRWLPWAVTLASLAYLIKTSNLSLAAEVIERVSPIYFVLLLAGGVLLTWIIDALSLTILFGRLNAPVSLTDDILPMRAVSYFLNAFHYAAAGGGMALYLKDKKGVPFLEALSSFLFLNFIDFLVLGALIPAGMLFGEDLAPEARHALLGVVAALGLGLVGVLLYFRAGFDFLFLGKLRRWSLLSAFARARLRDYAALFGARLLLIVAYVGIEYLFLGAFGLTVPLPRLMVAVPVVTLIGLLPVSVGGLGVPQEAMIRFYAPFITAADPRTILLAYSTLRFVSHSLARLLLGYFFLGRVSRGAPASEAPKQREAS